MQKVRVSLEKHSYDILIGDKIISEMGRILKRLSLPRDVVIITNPAIYSLHKRLIKNGLRPSEFNVTIITIPDSETSKSNRQVVKLIESIARLDKGRPLLVIAFGGGVVGDVAGFVASIYKRGIPYIQVPTTLLAQVDSAIGGKVAIDLNLAKNLVGAFYQPRLVISDISLLRTLALRQIRAGLSEIIKYGIIEDKRLFDFLENNMDKVLRLHRDSLEYVIYRCSFIKARMVGLDEFDRKGIRARLNFGHTIGHAIEAAARYSKRYSHGEAVAIGIAAAAGIALKMGILDRSNAQRIIDLIKKAGLPINIPKNLKIARIMKAQLHDKKIIRGVNRFVLPTRIGDVKIYEGIRHRLICEVIRSMQR